MSPSSISRSLKVLSKVKTGQNPDSIIYEPVTHRVFTFNGRSKDSTAIDAKTGNVITASIPVGGKPEFAQVDGKGHVYANIEDKNEIIEIDAKNALVAKRYSIAPCDSPSGLTIDPKSRLYSVCENHMMIVSDPAAAKVLATPAIGGGPDGVAFDDGYAFSANGQRRHHHDGRREWAASSRPSRRSRPSVARAPSRQIRRRTSCICPPLSMVLPPKARMARRDAPSPCRIVSRSLLLVDEISF